MLSLVNIYKTNTHVTTKQVFITTPFLPTAVFLILTFVIISLLFFIVLLFLAFCIYRHFRVCLWCFIKKSCWGLHWDSNDSINLFWKNWNFKIFSLLTHEYAIFQLIRSSLILLSKVMSFLFRGLVHLSFIRT